MQVWPKLNFLFNGFNSTNIMSNIVNISVDTLNDFYLGQGNNEATPHFEILNLLIDDLEKLDFVVLAFPQSEKIKKEIEKLTQIEDKDKVAELTTQLEKLKVKEKHYLILSIENLLKVAKANDFGLCKNNDFIYLFNGAYWSNIDKENFQKFLGEASEKMGVAKFDSRHYQFIEKLFKQFIAIIIWTVRAKLRRFGFISNLCLNRWSIV